MSGWEERSAKFISHEFGSGDDVKYKIAIHHTDEGVSVSVPALPGCWSEGDTEEEALVNIEDAIREYLAALEDRFQERITIY